MLKKKDIFIKMSRTQTRRKNTITMNGNLKQESDIKFFREKILKKLTNSHSFLFRG